MLGILEKFQHELINSCMFSPKIKFVFIQLTFPTFNTWVTHTWRVRIAHDRRRDEKFLLYVARQNSCAGICQHSTRRSRIRGAYAPHMIDVGTKNSCCTLRAKTPAREYWPNIMGSYLNRDISISE